MVCQGWKEVGKEIRPIYCWCQAAGDFGWSPLCGVSAESWGTGWEGGLAGRGVREMLICRFYSQPVSTQAGADGEGDEKEEN